MVEISYRHAVVLHKVESLTRNIMIVTRDWVIIRPMVSELRLKLDLQNIL